MIFWIHIFKCKVCQYRIRYTIFLFYCHSFDALWLQWDRVKRRIRRLSNRLIRRVKHCCGTCTPFISSGPFYRSVWPRYQTSRCTCPLNSNRPSAVGWSTPIVLPIRFHPAKAWLVCSLYTLVDAVFHSRQVVTILRHWPITLFPPIFKVIVDLGNYSNFYFWFRM